MDTVRSLKQQLFRLNEQEFEDAALEVFHLQARENPVYRDFLGNLPRFNPKTVRKVADIPFMPIEFFKSQRVLLKGIQPKMAFESSGTTGQQVSRHYIGDPDFYGAVATQIFENFYGPCSQYCFLALLPSYLERQHASLVFMAQRFVEQAGAGSGFFLNNYSELENRLAASERHTLLLGVTFALLDLAERMPKLHNNTIVMETGGMKGRRKEMTRAELHQRLKKDLGVSAIHGEYGMTELLSQFYAKRDGRFRGPVWAKILLRDITDPLSVEKRHSRSGGVNIIDLANIESCAFLATQDIGKQHPDGSFEILGRFDASDVRGCNLMVS